MPIYSVDANGRYHTGKVANQKYQEGDIVDEKNVPGVVKNALKQNRRGTPIDDLGDVVNPQTDTDDTKDENLGTDPKKGLTPAQKEAAKKAKEEEAARRAKEDEDAEEDDEEEIVDPNAVPVEQDEPGMGWKRVKGKTVSIFSNVPHETVKAIAGYMVPLTQKEYEEKSDADILKKLRELKKI